MIGDATLNAQERGKSGNALYGAYGQDFKDEAANYDYWANRSSPGTVKATTVPGDAAFGA